MGSFIFGGTHELYRLRKRRINTLIRSISLWPYGFAGSSFVLPWQEFLFLWFRFCCGSWYLSVMTDLLFPDSRPPTSDGRHFLLIVLHKSVKTWYGFPAADFPGPVCLLYPFFLSTLFPAPCSYVIRHSRSLFTFPRYLNLLTLALEYADFFDNILIKQ